MGANATTFVPAYVSGEVLTAADLTVTNSGIPVFADSTARDAAFGGTGEKTLAEGQYAYLESTNATQVYDGAAWQVVGASGLTLIKTQTIGTTVSSVAVTDAFSATYDAYKITIAGGVASDADGNLNMILTGSTASYYSTTIYASYGAGSATVVGANNGASWLFLGSGGSSTLSLNMELVNPFLAKPTMLQSAITRGDIAGTTNGRHAVSTSYTGFTISPASGTLTGGTIRVYGYANS